MFKYETCQLSSLNAHDRNARQHSKKQIKAIAASIKRFGFVSPIIATDDNTIVAGHARAAAAKLAGLTEVPVVRFSGKSADDIRAYLLADNQHALKSSWDFDILAQELEYLSTVDLDIETTGFEIAEIDIIFDRKQARSIRAGSEDCLPDLGGTPTSRMGDVWLMGDHRLVVGDSQDPTTFGLLMGDDKASIIISDVPYNVKIKGNVSGLGKRVHKEFASASGEMSQAEFTRFLATFMQCSVQYCTAGSLVYVFIDWRHVFELLSAAREQGLEELNMCVWNKTNAGMGSFYRSKHELCFVFKYGSGRHRNNVELGRYGRSRSNVWDYAGVNTFRKGRMEDLADHPTVKPAQMIADALRDASAHGEIVLDPFAGSGTIVIAAEMTGRRARAIEIDPDYADIAVRRYQAYTGKKAVLEGSSEAFETISERRALDLKSEGNRDG